MFSRMIARSLVMSVLAAGALAAQSLPGGLIPSAKQPPTRQGTRGANFLEIGVGARGIGLAGAVAGITEGPTSWYWNPAGVASMEHFGISASKQDLYTDLDITHNYIALAMPVLGGVAGVHFTSLTSGDLERTTEDNPFGDPVVGRTFSWSSMAVGVGYARRLSDRLDVGVSAKYIGEGITDARISWIGVDVGTQFRTGIYGLTLGAAVANIGPSSQYSGVAIRRKINTNDFSPQITTVDFAVQQTELPTLFRFDVATDLYGRPESILHGKGSKNALTGILSFNDAIDTDVQGAGALEYSWDNKVFLRGGKRFYNDNRATGSRGTYGLSGGLGLRLPVAGTAIRFDYAYTSLGDLDNVQVFSFEFGW
jgi:hypothetical protein